LNVDVIIVGAGLGGLAAGLRLAHAGQRVVILEKTDQVGGRNRRVQVGRSRFDGGPTLLMMLDPFRKLFADVGERIEDHLDLRLCEPSYRVFYSDGSRLDGSSNPKAMRETIRSRFGEWEAQNFERLLRDLKSLYEDSIPHFVRKNFYSPVDFFSPRQLGLVMKHGMLGNFAKKIGQYVSAKELRMLFSFQTMYLGLSPYDAPWVYAVLTHMEYGEGIYYPMGGMPTVSEKVADLAVARGAEIRLKAAVTAIDGNKVQLESGEELTAKTIVVNGDLPFAERNLLPLSNCSRQRKLDRRTYSCSAFMLYMDYQGHLPEMLHHNVFFGSDFKGNLDAIFHENALPSDPAFYACMSSRTDPGQSHPGHENLYVLVPCANLERPWTEQDERHLTDSVFQRLAKETGFDAGRVAAMRTYSPRDWRNELNLDRGAAFGLSHHFHQSAFFRPANRSKEHPETYFVGASTVPGNGLPMVLISAELLVDRLRHDGRM
jgi:phytoene desaturase